MLALMQALHSLGVMRPRPVLSVAAGVTFMLHLVMSSAPLGDV